MTTRVVKGVALSSRKDKVARSFGKAVNYDDSSSLQKEVARHLWEKLREKRNIQPCHVLEVGCGTGHLSEVIAADGSVQTLLATDISLEMVSRCAVKVQGTSATVVFDELDGEQPPPLSEWDVVCSSMAFQWFEDLPAALKRYASSMEPKAILAFSLPLQGSLREWAEFAVAHGLTSGLARFPDRQQIADSLANAGFSEVYFEEEKYSFSFPNPRAFLHSLRGIGATVPAEDYTSAGATALRSVLRETNNEPFVCSWRILFVYAVMA
jgi:malonyl-CoA O-methyltransferase